MCKLAKKFLFGATALLTLSLNLGNTQAATIKDNLDPTIIIGGDEQPINSKSLWISWKDSLKTPNEQHAPPATLLYADNTLGSTVWRGVNAWMLGGKYPSYYAKASDLSDTNSRIDELESRLLASIQEETDRATAAESATSQALATEIARAKEIESNLRTDLSAEITRSTTKDQQLKGELDAEIERSMSADETLQDAINTEIDDRQAADSTLQSSINTESNRAKNKESELSGAITTEANTRATQDQLLKEELDTEAERAVTVEESLRNAINDEIENRQTADSTLQTNINAEANRAKSEEGALSGAITDEITARTTQDQLLTDSINNERTRATNKENSLENLIEEEANRAESAESDLSTRITNEATTRASADSSLTTQLNNEAATRAAADTAEATARSNADEDLQDLVEEEESSRKAADSSLETKINNNYATLNSKYESVFQSASSGKALLAETVTNLGESTSSTATYQTISDNIESLVDDKTQEGYDSGYSAGYAKGMASNVSSMPSGSNTISSVPYSGIYDKQAHTISVTAAGGTIKYGSSLDSCTQTTAPSYTNAGSYTVYYSVLKDSKYLYGSDTVTISKKTLSYPTSFTSFIYDGIAKAPSVSLDTSEVTIGGDTSKINAGTYTMTFDLKDKTNYVWSNNTTTQKSTSWTIAKANGSVSTAPTGKSLTYTGTAQALINAGSTSTGTMVYRLGTSGSYSSSIPTATNAGSYTVYYYSQGDGNHNDSSTSSITVNISKKSVDTISDLGSYDYDGSTKYAANLLSNSAIGIYTSSGTYQATSASTYTAYLKLNDTTNYQWSDGTTSKKAATWTINKIAGSVSTAPSAVSNLKYNGSSQYLVSAGSTSTGTMYYYATDSSVTTTPSTSNFSSTRPSKSATGTYKVWYYSKGDSNHYDTSITYTTVTISLGTGSVTTAPSAKTGLYYNGSAQSLVSAGSSSTGTMYYFMNQTGTKPSTSTSGWSTSIPTGTTAGTYYVYYYSKGTTNCYTDTSVSSAITVTISKATAAISTTPSAKSLSYTGSAQNLVSAGSSGTGTVYYYKNQTGTAPTKSTSGWSTSIPTETNAGTYYVWYYVKATDSANYNDSSISSYITVTISKVTATYSTTPVKTSNWTYDAKSHNLIATAGASNGGTVKYSTDGSTYSETIPTATNAGTYTVYYKIVGNSNHNDSSASSCSITVSKADPSVSGFPTSTIVTEAASPWSGTISYRGDGELTFTNSSIASAVKGTTSSSTSSGHSVTSFTCTVNPTANSTSTSSSATYTTISWTLEESTNYVSASGSFKVTPYYTYFNGSAGYGGISTDIRMYSDPRGSSTTYCFYVDGKGLFSISGNQEGYYFTPTSYSDSTGFTCKKYKSSDRSLVGTVTIEKAIPVGYIKVDSGTSDLPAGLYAMQYSSTYGTYIQGSTYKYNINGTSGKSSDYRSIAYHVASVSDSSYGYTSGTATYYHQDMYSQYYSYDNRYLYKIRHDLSSGRINSNVDISAFGISSSSTKAFSVEGSQAIFTNSSTKHFIAKSSTLTSTDKIVLGAVSVSSYNSYCGSIYDTNGLFYSSDVMYIGNVPTSVSTGKLLRDGTYHTISSISSISGRYEVTIESNVYTIGGNTYGYVTSGANTSGAYFNSSGTCQGYFSLSRAYDKLLTAPTLASGWTYDASSHYLVSSGSAHGGTVQYYYSTSSTTPSYSSTSWSSTRPSVTTNGTYYVWYKVNPSSGYLDNYGSSTYLGYVTVSKAYATASTAPSMRSAWTYDESAHNLINSGTGKNGTMKYYSSTTNSTPSTSASGWTTTVPTATNAGTYYVWYYVAGTNGYYNSSVTKIGSLTVSTKSSLKAAPTANYEDSATSITYNGSSHELVKAGETYSGTMYYAVSTSTTVPSSGWSTSIPTKKTRGTYYVYYKITGASSNYYNLSSSSSYRVTVKIT